MENIGAYYKIYLKMFYETRSMFRGLIKSERSMKIIYHYTFTGETAL